MSKLDWRARKPGAAGRVEPPRKRPARAEELDGVRVREAANAVDTTRESEGLIMMMTDVVEEASGRFQVWGSTTDGRSVLVRVNDFCPYFYIAAPQQEAQADDPGDEEENVATDPAALSRLQRQLNTSLPPDGQIIGIEAMTRIPIMFYRPTAPTGSTYLQLRFAPGSHVKKAAGIVQSILIKGMLRELGLTWLETSLYEHEVSLLQRFLVDASLSGGAWIHIPQAASHATAGPGATEQSRGGLSPVPARDRISRCHVEALAPWRTLQSLTPDATQLADPSWSPDVCTSKNSAGELQPSALREAAESARRGEIAKLRLLSLDLVLAPRNCRDRCPVAATDPVVAIACVLHGSVDAAETVGSSPLAAGAVGDAAVAMDEGEEEDAVGSIADLGLDVGNTSLSKAEGRQGSKELDARSGLDKVVFVLSSKETELRERVSGMIVHSFGNEEALLRAWLKWFIEADPDAIVLFEAKDSLGALAQRFLALKIDGGTLRLSRLAPGRDKGVAVRRITMYSAAWVKSQSRMASTSNQETFRVEHCEGRVIFDILRHVLTACNLASFSLADCALSLLGRRLEVLPGSALAALAELPCPGGAPPTTPTQLAGLREPKQREARVRALRMARYAEARVAVVRSLLKRLATLPEAIELGRATGLTLAQVLYNAQMIRTWSLLLRSARRSGYIVNGRQDPTPLSESPYLMHPVETGHRGLHKAPVAILDFASLYPSLYRAHNLCYTTLLHPGDVTRFAPDQVFTTAIGATFVKPSVRAGVLPSILAALLTARAATRAELKQTADPAMHAVLDSRQKALKLTANALYGFTGAQASPLQCMQLADSCLALGAASCRRAREVLEESAAAGLLGPTALGARVIYAQTDSLFVTFPGADAAEAVGLGNAAAQLVSKAFPAPMELKFERVASPFLLLHVNRYAGRVYERQDEVGGPGALMVKGLKSMWRQAPPVVRTTLHGVLLRIVMQDDVQSAIAFAEESIKRLLGGRVELSEVVLTGGLWRVTGQQVERAAAVADGSCQTSSSSPPGSTGGGASEEDVRGPHASLAVRLQQRDPGRSFVLGERLGYVLLAGHRTQDEAAEDPLTAAKGGLQADYDLYWRNKLLRPLSEIFACCTSANAVQALVSGAHTLVRVDHHGITAPGGAAGTSGVPVRRAKKGGRQTGLTQFYRGVTKCLSCRRSMPAASGVEASQQPPLCVDCAAEEGVLAAVWLEAVQEASAAQSRLCHAHSLCLRCHSGGSMGPVLCENGECSVLYARLDSESRWRALQTTLKRLEW